MLHDSNGAPSRPIKVLQVTAVDFTVEKLLLPLIKALLANNYTVDIACAAGESAKSLRSQGYDIHNIPFSRNTLSISHFRALLDLTRLMRREHYDVVHVHTPIGALIGRLAAKIAGVPNVIYTAHGFYFHENMTPWLRHAVVLLEKYMCRFATDWLFTQSEEDASLAREKNFLEDARILWIGNGVDTELFSGGHSVNDLRLSLNIEEGNQVIGFIGRIIREKGIIDLINAFAIIISTIPNAKLLVVGDTLSSDRDPQAKEKTMATIQSHNLQDSVIFTGLRNDVPELLSAMDVFVLPSYREGVPRTIIEAMSSGKPVVATSIRGCREEVIHGETGFLVHVNDPARLAQAIIEILADDVLAKGMGNAGRKRAHEFFDENRVLAKELNVFRKISEGL